MKLFNCRISPISYLGLRGLQPAIEEMRDLKSNKLPSLADCRAHLDAGG